MAEFLRDRLDALRERGTYRELPGTVTGIDFWSNDYLGLARVTAPREKPAAELGATGSRLISGDRDEWHRLEKIIADFHGFPAALVFNSGYSALSGLLAALLKRTDTILFDELSHACCRDGIRLGFARSLRFSHNDPLHLRARLKEARGEGTTFVLTEGRFSMDGDVAPLAEIVELCEEFGAYLIVDEAHTGGLEGPAGEGLVAELGLQDRTFASVITYGKAFGAHGAAVLGSEALRNYLVNTARPFIYTTGMAWTQWVGIGRAYQKLAKHHSSEFEHLRYNILHYRQRVKDYRLRGVASAETGPIQTIGVAGNAAALELERRCRETGLLVKAIRSPTVAAGTERLRICLHAFNTADEIDLLLTTIRDGLANFAPAT